MILLFYIIACWHGICLNKIRMKDSRIYRVEIPGAVSKKVTVTKHAAIVVAALNVFDSSS